jgi:hypothetical protein
LIWIVALSVVIYYTAKVTADFKSGASFSQTINIKPTADSTYYLKLNDVKYLSGEDSVRLSIKEKFNGRVILDDNDNDEMNSPGNVEIYVERSDVPQPVLVESFSARGRTYEDALFNARSTTYQFSQVGNVLKFNRRLEKPMGMLWRNQELHLTLKMPINSKLILDDDIDRYIRGASVYDCKSVNKQESATSAKFIMTDNGLQCKVDTVVLPQPVKPVAPADSAVKSE